MTDEAPLSKIEIDDAAAEKILAFLRPEPPKYCPHTPYLCA